MLVLPWSVTSPLGLTEVAVPDGLPDGVMVVVVMSDIGAPRLRGSATGGDRILPAPIGGKRPLGTSGGSGPDWTLRDRRSETEDGIEPTVRPGRPATAFTASSTPGMNELRS
jgi:hypothetical protein